MVGCYDYRVGDIGGQTAGFKKFKNGKAQTLDESASLHMAFRMNFFLDGLIKKFKAWFCVCGDPQTEDLVSSTIRVLFIKLSLCSAQADVMAAFVHAELGPEEQVFVHWPTGFQCGQDSILSLNCFVYGLHQAPCYFFQHLKCHIK
ncbi:hypothetical protein ACHAW6_005599 [Cyclotella cf. meneghiniana]